MAFSKGACVKVLGVNIHPAVSGNPGQAVRIGVLRFRSGVCSGFVQLAFMGQAHPRLGFSDVSRLVIRLRGSTRRARTVLLTDGTEDGRRRRPEGWCVGQVAAWGEFLYGDRL